MRIGIVLGLCPRIPRKEVDWFHFTLHTTNHRLPKTEDTFDSRPHIFGSHIRRFPLGEWKRRQDGGKEKVNAFRLSWKFLLLFKTEKIHASRNICKMNCFFDRNRFPGPWLSLPLLYGTAMLFPLLYG